MVADQFRLQTTFSYRDVTFIPSKGNGRYAW